MNHATTENVRTPRAPHSNTPNTFVSGWNPNPKFKKKTNNKNQCENKTLLKDA